MPRERKDLKRKSNCRDTKPCTLKSKLKDLSCMFKLYLKKNDDNE
jgi:hypothetical protein